MEDLTRLLREGKETTSATSKVGADKGGTAGQYKLNFQVKIKEFSEETKSEL